MALTAQPMTRIFQFGSMTLPDPNPDMTPEQVRDFYAGQHPTLTTAHIAAGKPKGNTITYTLETSYGSKG